MTAFFTTRIELDGRGVAWIDGTKVKVAEVVLDKIAYGWSPEEIHFQHPHLSLAQIYAALNKKEDTFKWLQAAYEDRAVWMGYLAVDPIFDRYRSDERLKDLLRRVGLP